MTKTNKQNVQDVQETSTPKILTFELSLDVVNALIENLAKQPFNDVAQLINIIRSQAILQLQKNEQTEKTESK